MYEGKIIKFYREQAKMTQKELGEGICSSTHISKIERGITEYAPELTKQIAARLQKDIEQEIKKFIQIKEKLDMWHESIISLNMQAAETIQKELATNQLIDISDYHTLYYLLSIKYNLKKGNLVHIAKHLRKLNKDVNQFPAYEKNMYKHILGIYYTAIGDHLASIQTLESVDLDSYNNALLNYDLANAYHFNNSPVLAFYYAEKALRYYRQKNHLLGIIDTENLKIIQLESDQYHDFKETKKQYEMLLNLCEISHSHEKKAKLLHNYAYEYLRRKNYPEAAKYYKQSMDLKDKNTGIYVLSLEGFIRASMEGELLSREKLLKYVHEGLEMCKKIDEKIYKVVLTIHKYALLQREKQYFHFIATKALPFLREHGYMIVAERYEKELFEYYSKTNEKDKALQLAAIVMERLGE